MWHRPCGGLLALDLFIWTSAPTPTAMICPPQWAFIVVLATVTTAASPAFTETLNSTWTCSAPSCSGVSAVASSFEGDVVDLEPAGEVTRRCWR
jgi:hypothetical protein